MHIPDGFLSTRSRPPARSPRSRRSATACGAPSVDLDERRVPLLGVTAAFVFAAQMLNFPVAGGTSGHFLGAALAAVLLGPWLACLVLAVVLVAQAFVFADGGITALGANVLNMGVIGALLVGGLMLAARRGAARHARRAPRRRRRRRLAGGHGRRRRLRDRARDLGHRAARHRAAGDARRPRADRRRRGRHHRRRGQRRARHPAGPDRGSAARAARSVASVAGRRDLDDALHDPRARRRHRPRHRRLAVRRRPRPTGSRRSRPTRRSLDQGTLARGAGGLADARLRLPGRRRPAAGDRPRRLRRHAGCSRLGYGVARVARRRTAPA